MRMGFYLLSCPVIAGFLCMVPQGPGWLSAPGHMSMYVYLLHPLLLFNPVVMKLVFDALSTYYRREVNVWSPATDAGRKAVLVPQPKPTPSSSPSLQPQRSASPAQPQRYPYPRGPSRRCTDDPGAWRTTRLRATLELTRASHLPPSCRAAVGCDVLARRTNTIANCRRTAQRRQRVLMRARMRLSSIRLLSAHAYCSAPCSAHCLGRQPGSGSPTGGPSGCNLRTIRMLKVGRVPMDRSQ